MLVDVYESWMMDVQAAASKGGLYNPVGDVTVDMSILFIQVIEQYQNLSI